MTLSETSYVLILCYLSAREICIRVGICWHTMGIVFALLLLLLGSQSNSLTVIAQILANSQIALLRNNFESAR
jgi:hypothetical protein